jgi:hypothetical protein
MLVLFDNGTPRTLARYLIDHHTVTEARARGWEELENGELLTEAEAAGFEISAKPHRPKDSHRRIRARTLEPYQAACGASCRGSERSHSRQLAMPRLKLLTSKCG